MISFNTNINGEFDSLNILVETRFLSYPQVPRPAISLMGRVGRVYKSAEDDSEITEFNYSPYLIKELTEQFAYANQVNPGAFHTPLDTEPVIDMTYLLGHTGIDIFEQPIPIDISPYIKGQFVTIQLQSSMMAQRIFHSFDYSHGKINVIKALGTLRIYYRKFYDGKNHKYNTEVETRTVPVYLHTFMTKEYYNSIDWNLPYIAPIYAMYNGKMIDGEVDAANRANEKLLNSKLNLHSYGMRTTVGNE